MNTICVYYDLNDPQRQYQKLAFYVENFHAYAKAGSNIWFINSNKSCANIRDDINRINMPDGFRTLVFKVGDIWSSTGLNPETSNWFHKNWMP